MVIAKRTDYYFHTKSVKPNLPTIEEDKRYTYRTFSSLENQSMREPSHHPSIFVKIGKLLRGNKPPNLSN